MNRDDPQKICDEISSLLSQLEGALSSGAAGGIRLPPGIIPTVEQILPKYGFIRNRTIQRNIAYASEFLDYLAWLLNRFAIYGPILGYVIKVGVLVTYSIVEAMVWDLLNHRGLNPGKKVRKNLKKLRLELGVDEALCNRIIQVRERRRNIHLARITELEATDYSPDDWASAARLLEDVRVCFERLSAS